MKPPSRSEIPHRQWNFLEKFVPESLRGPAAIQHMNMVNDAGRESLIFTATQAAKKMQLKMRYRKWTMFGYGSAAGLAAGVAAGVVIAYLVF